MAMSAHHHAGSGPLRALRERRLDRRQLSTPFDPRRTVMRHARSIGAIASLAALLTALAAAPAQAEATYPDWSGAWSRIGNPRWDTTKPEWAQEPPLTPEYQKIYEANVADMKAGGQGADPTYTCLAPGMPRSMIVYHPMEVVITPNTTYLLIDHIHD